ncbi:serine/threonine-protein kinase/endoribonuclease ire-1-like [Daphnia carinata]|uniref:serine/threonine-protein kinase/endoribonuclease ire-1-like n=1 Tax=Daphnia carinata TaxID=120202 RepID=UPI00257D2D53|nr:serine/threonine-protein kinase/endoribonuclease ire-1-like [Daphnia carinata]
MSRQFKPKFNRTVKFLVASGFDAQAKDKYGMNVSDYLCNKEKKGLKIWIERDAIIGEGRFGTIFHGNYERREVAVKRVEKRHVKEIEEEALLKFDHPNIVKLLHCEKDNDFMYYALELCVASLNQLFLPKDDLQKYKGRMPRQIEIFHQLASGLAYIHSMKLIHRDMNPRNIFIMRRAGEDEGIIMKWSGFDLAKSVNLKGYWLAPEVLKKLSNKEKAPNEEILGSNKSDVFCLGLVFGYILSEGEHLFGSYANEIDANIIRKKPVNMMKIRDELRKFYEDDLLTKILEHEPEKRMSSAELVEQLESIKNKLKENEKEKEFLLLCARDSSPDLVGKIKDFIRLGINVNVKDFDGRNALHYCFTRNSNPNLHDAIQLLVQLGIDVNAKVKGEYNARTFLLANKWVTNKDEILKLLDEVVLV